MLFILGAMLYPLAQPILAKLRGAAKITLKTNDVLWARGSYWVSLALVVWGFFALLGTDGEIYQNFAHYQAQVYCFPRNYSANIYPDQMKYAYYTYRPPGIVNYTMLYEQPSEILDSATILPEWAKQGNQTVPYRWKR